MSSARQALLERVGQCPKDHVAWLYAARGLYRAKEYHLVIDAVSHCLRNEQTVQEAQHLLVMYLRWRCISLICTVPDCRCRMWLT